ncbi:hypothetical protein H072_2855 [Dactylellina haptotyla CBS 200.50]|uniref:PA14 domain-containing protein n=1 Tax=Dactylellina haptotyla (strain CBS 200.50) TaxID=1284197 RepID=S8AJM2_DACHA|nr:hypothetical protein H072_2855 [Dactylellina haptotyla CBS 200.50]
MESTTVVVATTAILTQLITTTKKLTETVDRTETTTQSQTVTETSTITNTITATVASSIISTSAVEGFDSEYFKTKPVRSMGMTDSLWLSILTGDTTGLNSWAIPANKVYVYNYRGYFYAPKTLLQHLMNAGTFTPFRLIYGNGGESGSYNLTVVDSNGSIYIEYGSSSPYLVAYSCGDSARSFPGSFGSENIDNVTVTLTATAAGPTVTTTATLVSTTTTTATTTTTQTDTFTPLPETVTMTETATFTPAAGPVTTTATTTLPPMLSTLPDTSCNNAGYRVAMYDNSYLNEDHNYSFGDFQPDQFKSVIPLANSTTNRVGFTYAESTPLNFYGFQPADLQIALNYCGYFYAPNSTWYNFHIYGADDFAEFWVGTDAYSRWTRSNGYITQHNTDGSSSQATAHLYLPAGTYLPLRILYANGGFNGSEYRFEIYDNSNNYYAQFNSECPYFVSYSCYEGIAPQYSLFGQEHDFAKILGLKAMRRTAMEAGHAYNSSQYSL